MSNFAEIIVQVQNKFIPSLERKLQKAFYDLYPIEKFIAFYEPFYQVIENKTLFVRVVFFKHLLYRRSLFLLVSPQ